MPYYTKDQEGTIILTTIHMVGSRAPACYSRLVDSGNLQLRVVSSPARWAYLVGSRAPACYSRLVDSGNLQLGIVSWGFGLQVEGGVVWACGFSLMRALDFGLLTTKGFGSQRRHTYISCALNPGQFMQSCFWSFGELCNVTIPSIIINTGTSRCRTAVATITIAVVVIITIVTMIAINTIMIIITSTRLLLLLVRCFL